MSRWTRVSIFLTVILIGIPTAAKFYSPLVAGLAEQIPVDLILTWMARLGLLALGVLMGWFGRGLLNPPYVEDSPSPSDSIQREEEEAVVDDEIKGYPVTQLGSIEGCIEVEGSCWRGTAGLSEGELVNAEVSYRAICPQCQTIMYNGENRIGGVATTSRTYWDCPGCGHRTVEQYSKYEDAQNLFESHIRRILESEGEVYSLDNLLDSIDGEITPRGVWVRYAEIVEDPQVSLNCFP